MQHFSLKRYQDFKQILKNYSVPQKAKDTLAGLQFVLLVAPTSTGRNTIIRHLLDLGNYYFIVADTTRPPQFRDGKMEENGVNYFFRGEDEVLADLKEGKYLEAALIHEQQVSGISIRELQKAKAQNKIAVTDIEIVGTDNIMRVKPDATAIFLLPPSFEEWQRRIYSRGGMSEEEIKNRLISATKEFRAALGNDYFKFVISDNVEKAAAQINAIAKGRIDSLKQQKGRALVEQLQQELQNKLKAKS